MAAMAGQEDRRSSGRSPAARRPRSSAACQRRARSRSRDVNSALAQVRRRQSSGEYPAGSLPPTSTPPPRERTLRAEPSTPPRRRRLSRNNSLGVSGPLPQLPVASTPASPSARRSPTAADQRSAALPAGAQDPAAAAILAWVGTRSKGSAIGCRQLPPGLFDQVVAPFLRFGEPVPNQLYALGGRNQLQDPLDTVDMFDTWHGRWVRCPSMLSRRAGCAAAMLPDGRLLVTGGYDEKGIVEGLLSTCEAFNPVTQAWEKMPGALRRARWGHGCALLGGKIYAVGGCSLRPGAPPNEAFMETLSCCECLDPATGSWSPGPSMGEARAGARVVALGERYLAAVGGCNDVFGRAQILPTVELFDSAACCWHTLQPQLSTPRTTAAVAALDSNSILVTGGAPSLSSSEIYRLPKPADGENTMQSSSDQDKRPWVPSIAEGRMGCQAASLLLPAAGKTYPLCDQQCVVVVGGESGEDAVDAEARQLSSVLVYDTKTEKWWPQDAFPPMPTPRTAMALCVGPGKILGRP